MGKSNRGRSTTGEEAVVVVCWRCEHEWDGNKRPADARCQDCGADGSGEGECHTVDVTRGMTRASKVSP